MYGYIYKITNNINGKIYIGKHKYSRPTLDESYRASGVYINRSIEKYGWQNFTQELIDTADTLEELNHKECYYIKLYQCQHPSGYNLTDGGDGLSNPSDEVREKMASKKRGTKQSEDTKSKRIASLKKVEHTLEWRQKVSASNKGTPPSQLARQCSSEAHKGSVWYNNGAVEIMLTDGSQVPDGFTKGRLRNPFPSHKGIPHSPERIAKIALKKSGTIWCNNGTTEKMIPKDQPLPPGYVSGRIKKPNK